MENTVLSRILQDKQKWIDFHKNQHPLKNFFHHLTSSVRSFYAALSDTKQTQFILECKKYCPSKGMIRQDFNLNYIADVYKHYASVISVLTDEKYFHGHFTFLQQISTQVSQPILCKDFIIDPWQIYLARLYQADAILLMLSIMDDNHYQILAKVAHSLNMGILTEITNEEERTRAILLGAKVIGINNRNLHDFSIFINRTRILAPGIPSNIIVISESGIDCHRQIRELSPYVNGFLIGSSLMSQLDLNMAVRGLILGENKVCGITRAIDAKVAFNVGSVYGGFIFVSNSPRYISYKVAHSIIITIKLRYVGVFRNAPISEVSYIADYLCLNAVQLHGCEDQSYIHNLRKSLPVDCQIWKAINMSQDISMFNWNLFHVDRYLVDNGCGGSGNSFNWSLLNGIPLNNVILAGGISATNCIDAVYMYCAGLDLNSSIEISPGVKDHQQMKTIFQKLRSY